MSSSQTISENLSASASEQSLSALEVEVIDLFVRGIKVLGLPKSVGEIYGLLYMSPQPLALDTLVTRLQMSKGSASQGLKFLRNLGAVTLEYVAGDRRDHYAAQTELKKLVAGFVSGEIEPHLESGKQRLLGLQGKVEADRSESADFYKSRLAKLEMWRSRGGEVLDLLETVLT